MVGIGAVLVEVRPAWTPAIEDQVVVACWLVSLALWAWLLVVGSVHAWATRTGRSRWRRLTGGLLPASVRRQVEQLALAGLLVVPAAACSTSADQPAPVLVLEDTEPIEVNQPTVPGTNDRAVGDSSSVPGASSSTTTGSVTTTGATVTTLPTPTPRSAGSSASPTVTTPPVVADGSPPPSTVSPGSTAAADPGGAISGGAIPGGVDPGGAISGGAIPGGVDPGGVDPGGVDPDGVDPDRADRGADPTLRIPVGPGTRVVLRGDSLWSIAAERVAAALGRSPTDPEVGSYWATLLDENSHRLASGDPDLIYPGEIVLLPPVP